MITLAYYTRNSLVYPCSCLTTSHLGWVVGTNILWLKSATWSILVPIHSATPGWKVAHPVQWLVQVLCSGKLLREKTFANFAVLWLFGKKFSPQNLEGVVSFGMARSGNPRKFSPQKFTKVFSLKSFPLYGIVYSAPLFVCFQHKIRFWSMFLPVSKNLAYYTQENPFSGTSKNSTLSFSSSIIMHWSPRLKLNKTCPLCMWESRDHSFSVQSLILKLIKYWKYDCVLLYILDIN